MPVRVMNNYTITAVAFAAAFAGAALLASAYREVFLPDQARVPAPDVPFGPLWDSSLSDPDNPSKKFRVDFARLEHDANLTLTHAHRMKLTPENIKSLSQEEVDQIYGRLTAGPIPDGIYRGDLFFARSAPEMGARGRVFRPRGEETLQTRLGEILGGLPGRILDEDLKRLELAGRLLWKGKVFYRDRLELRNQIENLSLLRFLIDEPDKLRTERVPRGGLLGRVLPNTTVWLLFPAKVYCGQSLLDGRRESVIVDYAYTDEVEGYQQHPDALAGRNGLAIRDEIRMVRPGFYLGRAYSNRMFLLNFTVYNEEVAAAGSTPFEKGQAIEESCWAGEQKP